MINDLTSYKQQPDNATRVEELGVGKRLNLFTCDRQQLVDAIDFLLFDPTVRKRIKEIGDRIQKDNGWEEVTKQLLPFLNKTQN